MGPKKKTVIDDILDYINPKPVAVDSDGELDADVAGEWYESSEVEQDEPLPSRGRKRGLDVSEFDERYAGKKLSRSKLGIATNRELDTGGTSLGGFETVASSGEDEGVSGDESGGGSAVERDSDSEGPGDESDSEGPGDSEEAVDNEGALYSGEEQEEQDQFQHISRQDVHGEVEKGKAVKQQLELWDSLLECRIRFQKCLLAANCLPRQDVFKEVMCNSSPELKTFTQKTRQSVSQLLGKLIELRSGALDLFTETARKEPNGLQRKGDGNEADDEIPSSEEDDALSVAEGESKARLLTMEQQRPGRKMSIRRYGDVLKEAHEGYREYRNATIQKWNDKTRVAVGNLSNKNFSAFEQSTVKQIEQILRDRQRLVQRSQLKRASYAVLGQDEEEAEERDVEVFDDGDWYQQLVRELIERKCASVSDPAQLGRQWLQLQKLRSKMKRKVDTRATKGRKVSYVVHPKLVSFMAPVVGDTWSDTACSELYGSLFGGPASQ